jgi:hypothetical protein
MNKNVCRNDMLIGGYHETHHNHQHAFLTMHTHQLHIASVFVVQSGVDAAREMRADGHVGFVIAASLAQHLH